MGEMSFPKQLPALTLNCALRLHPKARLIENDDLTMSLALGPRLAPVCPLLAPVIFEVLGMARFSASAFAGMASSASLLPVFQNLYAAGILVRTT